MGHSARATPFALVATAVLLAVSLLAGPAGAASTQPDPGAINVGDPDVTTYFVPDGLGGGPTTQDASGCNDNVCIYLKGSGLYLDEWRTSASVSSSTCSYARFHRNGSVIRTSSTVCSTGSGTLVAIWDNPGWFSDGDQLCNSWYGISGYPCKTIKS